MHFDVVSFFLNSLVLLFITMTLGNLFGNIKFRKFNFGITGTLFIGLIIGYFLTKYAVTFPENSKFYEKATGILKGNIIDKSIMNLSLMIFIVGTGLLAAKDMKYAIANSENNLSVWQFLFPLSGLLLLTDFQKF